METLTRLREKRGVTAREVARKIKRPTSTVATWFNGESEPKVSDLVRLADYFGVTLDELAGRTVTRQSLSDGEVIVLNLVRRMGVEAAHDRLTGDLPIEQLPGYIVDDKPVAPVSEPKIQPKRRPQSK